MTNEYQPYPFAPTPGLTPPAAHAILPADRSLLPVLLSGDRAALLATSHADVRAILTDPRFSRAGARDQRMAARRPESFLLHTVDPPDHTRRRSAVLHAFTATRATSMRPEVEHLADELLDAVAAAGPSADLVAQFTLPLALTVICRVLGVAADEAMALRPAVDVLMSLGGHPAERVDAAHDTLDDFFATALDAKRVRLAAGEPPADLLMQLLVETDPARELTPGEILGHASGLMIAGHETTAHMLAALLYLVLSRPGWAAELRAEPGRVPAAVEEMLRWSWFSAAGGVPPHLALADVTLPGGVVRAGELVLPAADAANRDPAVFAHPDDIDPDRGSSGHLAFGLGRHMCLGAPLARVELQVGLLALLHRLPTAALDGEPTWRQGMFIGGPATLPVRF